MPRKMSPETKVKNAERASDWNKSHVRTFLISMRADTEADLIAWLDAQPSKQAYVKALIKRNMEELKMKNFCGTISSEKGFLIGDPGYAIDAGAYKAACGQNGYKAGEYATDGFKFMFIACDDGVYKDSNGMFYDTDSGSLGLIPLELCTREQEYMQEYNGHIYATPGLASYEVTCVPDPATAKLGGYTTHLTITLPDGAVIKFDIKA